MQKVKCHKGPKVQCQYLKINLNNNLVVFYMRYLHLVWRQISSLVLHHNVIHVILFCVWELWYGSNTKFSSDIHRWLWNTNYMYFPYWQYNLQLLTQRRTTLCIIADKYIGAIFFLCHVVFCSSAWPILRSHLSALCSYIIFHLVMIGIF